MRLSDSAKSSLDRQFAHSPEAGTGAPQTVHLPEADLDSERGSALAAAPAPDDSKPAPAAACWEATAW